MTPQTTVNSNIQNLLGYYKDSIEFYLIRRLYGVIMLLLILSVFYPTVLNGSNTIPFLERLVKGFTLLFLAWRAMNFQLLELWIIPEGKLGRFYSVLLPLAFIVMIYYSFIANLTQYWIVYIAIIIFLYWIKPATFAWQLHSKSGTYFFKRINDESGIYRAIVKWHINVLMLWAFYVICAILDRYAIPNDLSNRLSVKIPFIDQAIGSVLPFDLIVLGLTILVIVIFSLKSNSHYYKDYLYELDQNFQDDTSINPWLLRKINK